MSPFTTQVREVRSQPAILRLRVLAAVEERTLSNDKRGAPVRVPTLYLALCVTRMDDGIV